MVITRQTPLLERQNKRNNIDQHVKVIEIILPREPLDAAELKEPRQLLKKQ